MEQVVYFRDKNEFYNWLEENHTTNDHFWVGFYKVKAEQESITWSESVDVALCFGWIDGIRKTIDSKSYKIRFTPRKENSVWSAVNVSKVLSLMESNQMRPEGLRVFNQRKDMEGYSSKTREVELDKVYLEEFMSNKKAWSYFSRQTFTYRRDAIWWIMSAKKKETQLKRLNILVVASEQDQKI